MNTLRNKINKYKEIKADIVDIDITLSELDDNNLKINELKKIRLKKENQIRRIDNAITVLKEPYNEIIEEILIKGKRYSYMQEKLHLSYSRIKQLENEALQTIEKYIL
ncbi:hypothetical protein [Clostridium botulinum]|uniref:hypothetical protein n=1 Tax=Clostridium botulinum TaxID=1491 RepID=UPI0013FB7D09|nr:hypothetical protein [Clostridium botulinum]MBN1079296.1 hypothetical protein [Clostridium botulinum]NFO48644.1 hypothetical protein [Clostridium botulinum]